MGCEFAREKTVENSKNSRERENYCGMLQAEETKASAMNLKIDQIRKQNARRAFKQQERKFAVVNGAQGRDELTHLLALGRHISIV